MTRIKRQFIYKKRKNNEHKRDNLVAKDSNVLRIVKFSNSYPDQILCNIKPSESGYQMQNVTLYGKNCK